MKIRNIYLLFITIIGLISLAMYTTYAMFTASVDIGEFVNLTASSLPTDTSVVEYERLSLNAGETKIIDLNITNTTNDSLYYGVWYEMIEPTTITEDITIAKLDTSASNTIGQLTTNTSNVVTLILENNTTDTLVINIGVGYSQTSSLNLPTTRNIVTEEASEGIDMSEVVIPETKDFDYTGAVQTYTVSTSGQYKLEVWGAQGGTYNSSYATGGAGGYSYGTVNLNEGDTLYVYVGKAGSYGTTTTYTTASDAGINGGGAAGYRGGTGGDASDIRLDINNDGSGTLYERIIVAGGGGGAYAYSSTYNAAGGVGGGTSGASGSYYSSTYSAWVGGGASQTAGGSAGTGSSANYYGKAGSFGTGGASGYKYNSTSYYSNGAGGGGWYGGGSAGNYSSNSRTSAAGGGGGSGFVLTTDTASNVPSGYLITDTTYYLTDAETIAGSSSFTSPRGTTETGHTGNGYARISYISTLPSLKGLTSLTILSGTSYDLLSDVTCVDNGDGCTLVKVNITNTSILALGSYKIAYIVKDNSGIKYKFTRNLTVVENSFNLNTNKLQELGVSVSTEIPSFTTTATTDEGMYATVDNQGTTYYFRGASTNNYVKFADYYWRIIRINGDNSIRLIYDGTVAHDNGEVSADRQLQGDLYTESTSSISYSTTIIKFLIDSWYAKKIEGTINEQHIAMSTYCSPYTNSIRQQISNLKDYSDSVTFLKNEPKVRFVAVVLPFYYDTYTNLITNKTPSLECSETADIYIGNIATIMADEIALAGGVYNSQNTSNTSYYLYTGSDYWTMSPSSHEVLSNVYDYWTFSSYNANNAVTEKFPIKPVLSLKSDTLFTGLGTKDDPFIIVES